MQLEDAFSPYTGQPLTDEETENLFKFRLQLFNGVIMLFCALNWFFQKDLITMCIKNHMIARQQTQLQEFFSLQEDPVFVLDSKGNIIFSNEAAKRMFESQGLKNVDNSAKIFLHFKSLQVEDKNFSPTGEPDNNLKSFSDLLGSGELKSGVI